MTKKFILELLEAEIVWCKGNKVKTMPDDWYMGFIRGLKQAKLLIRKANQNNHK